jgi:hypothetical protein
MHALYKIATISPQFHVHNQWKVANTLTVH